MIKILTELHDTFVPRTSGNNPDVLDKIEFAGDVLTNERAFAAQCAMSNGTGTHEALSGMNYRPGGLHLLMNLCVVCPMMMILLWQFNYILCHVCHKVFNL